eukprot:COSAG01_NODE_752_length_13837_cov_76.381670_20_plen_94_part_00
MACHESKILNAMPPAMKIEFATFLYAKYIANVPIFHGLSVGIVRALCDCVEPTFAVPKQCIYAEGTTGKVRTPCGPARYGCGWRSWDRENMKT